MRKERMDSIANKQKLPLKLAHKIHDNIGANVKGKFGECEETH